MSNRKSKHTPGPWRAEYCSDDTAWAIRGDGVHLPGTTANARLVAAAPELLAALVRFVNAFGGDLEGMVFAKAVAVQAIDKATGGDDEG